ncbi:hypothetical protein YC2023_054824 [Brassica napus]
MLEEVCFGENLSARRAREDLVAQRRIRLVTGFRVGLNESDERVVRGSSGSQSR